MCCTRSHVSGSRSMYSSSTPSVYGSLFPNAVVEHADLPGTGAERALAGDRRGKDLLHVWSITASASISTSHRGSSSCVTMPGGRGTGGREGRAVRAADLVDRRRVGDVDPCPHDVVERRTRFGERALDDRQADLRLLVRAGRRVGVARHDRRRARRPRPGRRRGRRASSRRAPRMRRPTRCAAAPCV